MKKLVYSVLSVFTFSMANAQAPHTIGNLMGSSTAFYAASSLLVDGGILTCSNDNGFTTVIRSNAEGEVQWSRNIHYDLMSEYLSVMDCGEWANGDLYVFGTYSGSGTSNAYFVERLDPQGNVIWGHTYDITSFFSGDYMTSTAVARGNGNLMLSIAQFSTMVLAEIDGNGGLLTVKNYSFDDEKSPGLGCIPTFDDGTVLCGKDSSDQCLIRLNSTGDVVWARTYENNDYTHARDVMQTEDGGFMVCGSHSAMYGGFGEMAFAMKLDANGDVVWHRTYTAAFDLAGLYRFEKVAQLPGGGYAFFSEDYTHQILVITDADGTPINSKATSIPGSEMNTSYERMLGVYGGSVRLAGYITTFNGMDGATYLLDRAVAIDGTSDCLAAQVNVTMESAAAPTTPDPDLYVGTPTLAVGSFSPSMTEGSWTTTDMCELLTGIALNTAPVPSVQIVPSMVPSGTPVDVRLANTDAREIVVVDAIGRNIRTMMDRSASSVRISTVGMAPGRYTIRIATPAAAPVVGSFVVR